MKITAVFLLFLSTLFVLTGCGAKNENLPPVLTESETTEAAVHEETPTEGIRIERTEPNMSKELTLMVNDTVIPVNWEDNTSVAELSKYASDKPIQIDMCMYGGWEQVGSLGYSISRNDSQMTALPGDIMLYSGDRIVLFYGENSWAYTKLGHIDLPKEEVIGLLSSGAVCITLHTNL